MENINISPVFSEKNKKIKTPDDFVNIKKQLGHKVKLYSFFNEDILQTSIYADHTDKSICSVNHTDNFVKTAFGRRTKLTWDDFCDFIEERCIPRTRAGLQEYLECKGLFEYDPFQIILKTQGRMAEDRQWLKVEEL